MLFNKNDENVRDRVIYKTKPNMLLGCKKAIFGIILLVIILFLSSAAIKFIGEMQVYLISYVKLSLTRYVVIAFFIIILIDVIYIIWQLVGWYSLEYTLTETRIIIKSGVLTTKKNYMPYSTIQDINTSQSFLARMFNVGSVSAFSAYDNNQIELKNISDPSKVEEIIFSRMVGPRNFQSFPQGFPQCPMANEFENEFQHRDNYVGKNDYYDEYEPITPITHESNFYPRRDYEYYPEDIDTITPKHHYEYEPYEEVFNKSQNSNSHDNYYSQRENNNHYDVVFNKSQNSNSQDNYDNQVKDEYSYSDDNYYQNNDSEIYYDEGVDEFSKNDVEDVVFDSSQKAIERHFGKFKK